MISIHPPRAGRDPRKRLLTISFGISIHPPRAGRDVLDQYDVDYKINFNPPAPCGAGPGEPQYEAIAWDFNPPAPCGAGLCGKRS